MGGGVSGWKGQGRRGRERRVSFCENSKKKIGGGGGGGVGLGVIRLDVNVELKFL